MKKVTKCLACNRIGLLTRGNCSTHYSRLLKAVQKGETTWQQLESEGKTLPQIDKVGFVNKMFKCTRQLSGADKQDLMQWWS